MKSYFRFSFLAAIFILAGCTTVRTFKVDAIEAQRDFWLAETDLQWTLQGGVPTRFVSPGGVGTDAAAPAQVLTAHKAYAYGLGVLPVAEALAKAGASAFGVAASLSWSSCSRRNAGAPCTPARASR